MILNLGSAIFNTETKTGGNTPAWGTEMGQGEGYRYNFENYSDFLSSLLYTSIPNPQNRVTCPLGKGGNRADDYEFVVCGHYTKVYVNGELVKGGQFDLLVVKKLVGDNHVGRRTLKYNPRITVDGICHNSQCYELMAKTLGVSDGGAWFISEINTLNQDQLHFTAHVLNADGPYIFEDSADRTRKLSSYINKDIFKEVESKFIKEREANEKEPLQIIFYGAPGTGKSYTIDDMTDEDNSVRTTFHPDTDYSTFVGAYKPTMQRMPIHAIVGTNVHRAKDAQNQDAYEQKIVYKYVPQAFLKAYVAAWRNLDAPYYLIIEEINRGNCAQIFGDLFQLLDRNNSGCSAYAIHADEDIAQFLGSDPKGFAGLEPDEREAIAAYELVKDNGDTVAIGADILSGKKLLLPPNLRIWATMNTSDQSLFPIDSAFKRRWNWKYVPINLHPVDKRGEAIEWQFEVGGKRYMWADFLGKINPKIYELTQSSDKQMGYFFAKPDVKTPADLRSNNLISESIFLNKVLFYLWTDVLKDFETGDSMFKDEKTGKMYIFADFFEHHDKLTAFVDGLGLTPVGDAEEADIDDVSDDKNEETNDSKLSIVFPDGETINGNTRFEAYSKALQKIGLAKVEPIAAEMKYTRLNSPLVSKDERQPIVDAPDYTYVQIDGYYLIKGMNGKTMRNFLNLVSDKLGLGLQVIYK